MADKKVNNNDDSIARVYKFLTDFNKAKGDWTQKADTNNDNTIVKSEFAAFIKNNFNNWNGEEKTSENQKYDLINKFWSSIDVNKVGKVSGTGISNVNALDSKELANVERGMTVSLAVDNFVATLNPPQQLASKKAEWKASVRASLITKALDYARTQGASDAETFASDLQGFLQETYKQTERMTNADYVAQMTLAKINIKGYKYGSDDTLKGIIDSYITSIADKDVDFQDIYDTVTCLVNDYLATAAQGNGGKVGSSTAFDTYDTDEEGNPVLASRGTDSNTTPVERLELYGYLDGGMLNELQTQVLTNIMTEAITTELSKSSYSNIYNADNKASVDVMISNFIDSKLATATSDDFDTLKNFNAAEFVNSTEFATMKKAIEDALKALADAKAELKSVLSGKYTDKYKGAIKEVFGKDTQSEVEKIIDGYLTPEEANSAKDKIVAKFAIEDAKIDVNDFFKELKDNYTVFAGSSEKVATLPNNYGTHSTGTLLFSSSNPSFVEVDSNGNVTIKGGTTAGKFLDGVTITVTDKTNGMVLGTKNIGTITVLPDLSQNNSAVFSLYNDAYTFSSLINSSDWIVKAWCQDEGGTGDADEETSKNIKKHINAMSTALKSEYPDISQLIDKAASTTISFYENLIQSAHDNSGSSGAKSVKVSYFNSFTNKQVEELTTFSCRNDDDNDDVDSVEKVADEGGRDTNTGLYYGRDEDSGWNGDDDIYIYADMRMVAKKFLSFIMNSI